MRFEDTEQPNGWYPWNRPRLVGIPDKASFDFHPMHAVFRMPDEPLRSFRVVVDARLQLQVRSDPVVKYLLELVATPPIEAHLFESGQSPPRAEQMTFTETDVHAYKDWMTIEPGAGQRRYVHFVQDRQPKKRPLTSTSRQFFGGLAVEEQTRELLLVAHYSRSDLVITTRVTAEELPSDMVGDLDILTPDLALPVIGLYLRAQGMFVYGNRRILGGSTSEPSISKQPRSIFYWELANILTPQLPTVKWLVAKIPDSGRNLRWDASGLCRSLVWRIEQILRSRDRLLSNAFSVPLDHGSTDEIASEVDTIVLYAMSVLDITARLTELLFPTEEDIFPGWQNGKWLRKLKKHAPETAYLFKKDTSGYAFIQALKRIRNMIHEQAFSVNSVTYIVGPYRFQPLVRLAEEMAEDLHTWLHQLGGDQDWGLVKDSAEEGKFIHLGVFAERLCQETFRMANSVLKMIVMESSNNRGVTENMPSEVPISVSGMRILLQTGLVEFAGSPFRDEPVALDEHGTTMIRIKRRK